MSDKWGKPQAGYIEKPNTQYQCKDCHFWMNKLCALYGEKIPIEEDGTCILWVQKEGDGDKDFVGTTTKKETGYEENADGFSCKRCEYFQKPNGCKKVDGRISPDGCCNHWEKNTKANSYKLVNRGGNYATTTSSK